jgi:hypothetical protein
MTDDSEVSEKLMEMVRETSPETVKALIARAHEELGIPEDRLLKLVVGLQNDGKLNLISPPETVPANLTNYVFSTFAAWFWVIIILSSATTISVFLISEGAYPLVFIRYVLGTVFILFLPGYSLVKALFPSKEIDNIERIALSMGLSLALVPMVGLLLNYTPWGIRLTPVTLSLLALTVLLATTALIREHQIKASTTS